MAVDTEHLRRGKDSPEAARSVATLIAETSLAVAEVILAGTDQWAGKGRRQSAIHEHKGDLVTPPDSGIPVTKETAGRRTTRDGNKRVRSGASQGLGLMHRPALIGHARSMIRWTTERSGR